MVATESRLKRCEYCGQEKSVDEFYQSQPGVLSSRCRHCHGLAYRTCSVCGKRFLGRRSMKACSPACHRALRPPTFRLCDHCGCLFGPLPRLTTRFCSYACKAAAQRTGRKKIRKATAKARHAQTLVRNYVRSGLIRRPTTCEECGASDCQIEAAHFDYDKPLRVRWLCRSCHVRWDKREPKHGTVLVHTYPLESMN